MPKRKDKMIELRKKLTDTQFRLLVNAQVKYDRMVVNLEAATEELNTVRALVLDALEVNATLPSFIDASTQELVFEEKETETETD